MTAADPVDAAYYSPPLTTVRQDFEALGRLAMRRLLDAVEGGEPTEPMPAIQPELIARSSTTRPRRSAAE